MSKKTTKNLATEAKKPQKPAPDECCGGGSCCPCVWDEYRAQLQKWQASQAHR